MLINFLTNVKNPSWVLLSTKWRLKTITWQIHLWVWMLNLLLKTIFHMMLNKISWCSRIAKLSVNYCVKRLLSTLLKKKRMKLFGKILMKNWMNRQMIKIVRCKLNTRKNKLLLRHTEYFANKKMQIMKNSETRHFKRRKTCKQLILKLVKLGKNSMTKP